MGIISTLNQATRHLIYIYGEIPWILHVRIHSIYCAIKTRFKDNSSDVCCCTYFTLPSSVNIPNSEVRLSLPRTSFDIQTEFKGKYRHIDLI